MFGFRIGSVVFSRCLTGLGVTTLLIHLGIMAGWTSPTLARLSTPDSPIHLNTEQVSWIASLLNFGSVSGNILGAIAAHYFGSKKSILATLVPIFLGWSILVFASTVEWLYIARLFSGMGLGMTFSTFPVYLGEVSVPEIRGALISVATMGMPIGQVIASICGSYMSMSAAASIYLVLALALILLFLWLPESPHHLMKSGNQEAARLSIEWYMADKDVTNELQAVEKFVTADGETSFIEKIRNFKTPQLTRATLRIMILFTFMQTSGWNVITYFMEAILNRADFTLVKASTIVIYANLACTISSAISIFLIDRCGRKFLLILSSAGTAVTMICLATCFFLVDSNVDIKWLPAISVIFFMAFHFIGLMPVPCAILSETFPADSKCIAAAIANLTASVMAFISAKTYYPVTEVVGEAYVFIFYAICSLLVIPYTLYALPETKGKSLQQIQDDNM